MSNIYMMAWKSLDARIAKSRRQSISKADIAQWQLRALEEAVDRVALEMVYADMEKQHGEQEKA